MAAMTAAARSEAARKANETRRLKKGQPAPAPRPKIKLVPHTPIKLPKAQPTATVSEMVLKTVVLSLTIHRIGNYRKVDPDTVNIIDSKSKEEVNKDYFGVDKKLMKAPELETINSIANKARSYVINRALPSPIKVGVYLMPREFHEDIDEKLKGFNAEMRPHIELLAKNLPEYKKEAKRQQGPQFIEEQWPTANEILTAFRISWRWLFIDSAEGLKKEIYEEERKKAEADWAETRETIKTLLRTQMSDMVNHLVDRLKPDEFGKTKIFRESSFEKIKEFLGTFNARNITNDQQMRVLVEKANGLLSTADTDAIRNDNSVRDHVRHGFETIKTLLDTMITSRPHRSIQLED